MRRILTASATRRDSAGAAVAGLVGAGAAAPLAVAALEAAAPRFVAASLLPGRAATPALEPVASLLVDDVRLEEDTRAPPGDAGLPGEAGAFAGLVTEPVLAATSFETRLTVTVAAAPLGVVVLEPVRLARAGLAGLELLSFGAASFFGSAPCKVTPLSEPGIPGDNDSA